MKLESHSSIINEINPVALAKKREMWKFTTDRFWSEKLAELSAQQWNKWYLKIRVKIFGKKQLFKTPTEMVFVGLYPECINKVLVEGEWDGIMHL